MTKATSSISKILNSLGLNSEGYYDNQFYIIKLDSSDEYAKAYTLLSNNAINTEYPSFENTESKEAMKVTNYFEISADGETFLIFLIANFKNDEYLIKIGEQSW